MHARVIFSVAWINWNIVGDVYIFTKGKTINVEKNENVEWTQTQVFCGRLCVVRITATKNKLYYLLVQNTGCRLDIKCRLLTAEWVQNADWEFKVFFSSGMW